MNKPQGTNAMGIVALIIIIVFIHTLLSIKKESTKTTKQSVNINLSKRIQQTELTVETLRQYKGFETISETEAPKHIEVIQRLAKVLHYNVCTRK